MIKLLLKKEWKEQIRSRFYGNKKNVFGTIVGFIASLGVIALIVYILNSLNSRFTAYGVSKEIFTVMVFFLLILEIGMNLNKVTNILYNHQDSNVLLPLPVKPKDVILSKVIILYINEILSMAILLLSVIISFGVGASLGAYYYISALLLLLIVPLFALFIMILLSVPYFKIRQKLKEYPWLQLLVAACTIALFFILYRYVITIFIGLVNQDRLAYLFNRANATKLTNLCNFLLPANLLVNIFFKENLVVSITIIIVIIGIVIFASFYLANIIYYQLIKTVPNKSRTHKTSSKVTSVKRALYKKEIITMFRSSNYLFSYVTILLMLPLIVFIITSEMKILVHRMFGADFFLPFVILIVGTFATMINGFGSLVISREGQYLKTLKTLPVHFKTQVNVKLNIALAFAFISVLATSLLLVATGVIPFGDSVVVFVITILVVASLIAMLIKYDLKHPNIKLTDANEGNGSMISVLYAIFMPLAICLFAIFFSLVFDKMMMIISLVVILSLLLFLNLYTLFNTATKSFWKIEV